MGLEFVPNGGQLIKDSIKVDKVMHYGKNKFQEIFIGHSPLLGMFLALDGIVQSSEYDCHVYHETIVHPAMLSLKNPKNVLIIGGGEGTTAEEITKHYKEVKIDFVEIDEEVIRLSRRYLPYAPKKFDSNVNLVIGDGLRFLKNSKKKYDLIIGDLTDIFDGDSLSREIFTDKFGRLVKSKLTEQGMYVTLACGFDMGNGGYVLRPKYLTDNFPIVRPMCYYMPSFKIQMAMVIASKKYDPAKLSKEEVAEKIKPMRKKLKFYNENVHCAIFDKSYHAFIDDATYG